jgi:hypothetical protein
MADLKLSTRKLNALQYACLQNALRLHFDSVFLAKGRSFASAFAISVIASEADERTVSAPFLRALSATKSTRSLEPKRLSHQPQDRQSGIANKSGTATARSGLRLLSFISTASAAKSSGLGVGRCAEYQC